MVENNPGAQSTIEEKVTKILKAHNKNDQNMCLASVSMV